MKPNISPCFRPIACLAVCLLALAPAACVNWKLDDGRGAKAADRDDPDARPEAWEIKPVEVRVYPSSRFALRDGEPMLEARIEFIDAAGDSTKAVGQVRLELFKILKAGEATVGERHYTWQIDMLTLDANKKYYDAITQAYLFPLRIDDTKPILDPVLLKVTFIPVDGQRLEGQRVINEK